MKQKCLPTVLFLATALVLPNLAMATSTYQSAFNKLYKTKGTPLGDCIVCHTSQMPSVNLYGRAFANAKKGKTAAAATTALKKIQPLDSDKDGFTNIVEIKARTFPGKKTSHPSKVLALDVQSSSFTLANNYGSDEIAYLVFNQESGSDYRYVRVYGDRLMVGHVMDGEATDAEQSFDLAPWDRMEVELYGSGLVRVFLDGADDEAVASSLP
jgi:hypothetical protein